jgi:hypothetical protein
LQQVEVRGDTFIICNFDLADRIWGLSRHASQARQSGSITDAEMESWLLQLRSASQNGYFFSAIIGLMVCGTKSTPTA